MSTVATTARAAPARSRARTAARPRLLGGGVLWIVLFGALLAGVVAVNVTVLRLNLQLDEVGRERSELKADVADLRWELSNTSASARIERVATTELGLEQPDPDSIIFMRLQR